MKRLGLSLVIVLVLFALGFSVGEPINAEPLRELIDGEQSLGVNQPIMEESQSRMSEWGIPISLDLAEFEKTSQGEAPFVSLFPRDAQLPGDAQFPDAHSTSGPLPPEDLDPGYQLRSPEAATVLSLPAYLWYRGCGPTAAGMVLGYWDSNGFGNLVSGSAATQTSAVNAMISSTGNYNDYCLPLDYYPNMLEDKSELPLGDEHTDDSIADFMKTSQSSYSNYYGWSWFNHMDDALEIYIEYAVPEYTGDAQNVYFGSLSWEAYKAEIDAGRPVVFLVDTNADGSSDHFVPGIGYNEDGGTNLYACLNTWDTNVHWYEYAQMASGQSWGILGATLFEIEVDSGVIVINEVDPDTPDAVELYNRGILAVDLTGWELVINGVSEYTFPSFTLQPGDYVVVYEFGDPVNNTATELFTDANLNLEGGGGAVGLIDNTDAGVDFMRFGTSTTDPPTGTDWTGTNPPAVILTNNLGRESTSADSDDGGDWCLQSPSLGAQNYGCYCPAPGIPELVSPLDTSGTPDNSPTFDWEPASNAEDYQIQIDDYSSFATPILDLTTTSSQFTPSTPLSDGVYYWRVRGHRTTGCDVYGAWSEVFEVLVSTASPFDVNAAWTSSTLTLDGTINPAEWTGAAEYDITTPQAESREPAGVNYAPVTLYVMNDAEHLYLAVDNPNDITAEVSDSMGIYFDDNPLPPDGLWTNTTCGNLDGEGNFWAFPSTSAYREWIDGPAVCTTIYPAPGVSSAVSFDSGHIQIEVVLNLTASALRGSPRDVINMNLWVLDDGTGKFHGRWPLTAFFQDPLTYGSLTLAAGTYRVYIPTLIR